MPGDRRSKRDFDVRLGVNGATAGTIRRARRGLLTIDRDRRQDAAAIESQLELLRTNYQQSVRELIGAGGMRELRNIPGTNPEATRARIRRATKELLRELGVDSDRLDRIRRTYSEAVRELVAHSDILEPVRMPRKCAPWITYTAPFGGYSWSFAWSRRANADTPVLTRYLDAATGDIGSSIKLRVGDAGDDDRASADYYTGLNIWHTVQSTGPLEVFLAFEFAASNNSGTVRDEFGFSDATCHQWAGARLLAVDPLGSSEEQSKRIFRMLDFFWGEDGDWDDFAEYPRDIHMYHFKTAATFQQGRSVLLEAGIENWSWFRANDERVTMADDVHLRLDRIMVRSCRADPIL